MAEPDSLAAVAGEGLADASAGMANDSRDGSCNNVINGLRRVQLCRQLPARRRDPVCDSVVRDFREPLSPGPADGGRVAGRWAKAYRD